MNRRGLQLAIAWSILLLLGCSQSAPPLEERVPAQLNGWTRTLVKPIAADDAPEVVRQLGLKRAVAATYTGPVVVNVRVFEMKVPASAFELIQKWRQQDGLAVYSGPFFIAADPNTGADAAALLDQLSKALK